jgi:hypothetical protein
MFHNRILVDEFRLDGAWIKHQVETCDHTRLIAHDMKAWGMLRHHMSISAVGWRAHAHGDFENSWAVFIAPVLP